MSIQGSVRRAAPQDADALARHRWDFMVELGHRPVGTLDAYLPRYRSFLERALGSGRWQVWLAEDPTGTALGSVYLQTIEVVPRPSEEPKLPWGYVTTFFVVPEARDAGIGTKLLDALVSDATERGLELLQVWPSERSAPLYRRFGWSESDQALELPIIRRPVQDATNDGPRG